MDAVNRRVAIIIHDLCMIAIAWMLAYLTRYNFTFPIPNWDSVWQSLPIVFAIQGLILWRAGLYRGLWRFASIPDLWNIARAAVLGVLAITLALFLFKRMEGIPRTILLFYPLILVFLLGAPRFFYRMWKEYGLSLSGADNRQRLLILGAGRAGEMLARDLRRDESFQAVGYLDDQRRLRGTKVHGIPVLGRLGQLVKVAKSLKVDTIIIAMPSASSSQMRRVVGLCEKAAIPFRTLPRMQDLVSGRSSISALREVAIEDLLGRDPVSLDWARLTDGLKGRAVLVSGGGGSIGSELCRQIAKLNPAILVILENSEFNLYSMEMELQNKFPDMQLHCCLTDVTDYIAVSRVFTLYKPDIVFHAAAYKHVPMLEPQAREAIKNNVVGTKTIAQVADKKGCEIFVLVSTDKAVNPANIMGASKRIAEKYCQAMNTQSDTQYITVRFGNVLGSAGSVVPLFKKQIASGGPVTITHPDITRYFMTIPEASQLIMQAAVLGTGGEIFVLDMGEPIKITYLAEQMIRLSGKTPGEDISIEFTGLRPGEKLYEELFYSKEDLSETGQDKLLLAQSSHIDWNELSRNIMALEQAAITYDEDEIMSLIDILVPELSAHRNNIVELNQARAS